MSDPNLREPNPITICDDRIAPRGPEGTAEVDPWRGSRTKDLILRAARMRGVSKDDPVWDWRSLERPFETRRLRLRSSRRGGWELPPEGKSAPKP